MQLAWQDLGTPPADAADAADVTISGFVSAAPQFVATSHFILVAEPPCCAGCVPRDGLAAVEVFAAAPIPVTGRLIRLRGAWQVRRDNPAGWRYQLRDARLTEPPGWAAVGRRAVLTGAPLMCIAAAAPAEQDAAAQRRQAEARRVIGIGATIDMHSHAGSILAVRNGTSGLSSVAEPMRDGSMAAVCFAIASDSPCYKLIPDGMFHPYRTPDPGELYDYGQSAFRRLHALIERDSLAVIINSAGVAAARGGTPSAIVAAEGGDFLEGRPDRVDEAYERWQLRHLQLTHYRVNELGDIQTETPEHGGLTDAGVDVIRHCNRLGIVVDVAHGTFDLVKRAASVTTKPLVLSHTSLTARPGARSRQISPEHARLVASTGGVIGIWPPISIFPDLLALANGMLRMADVVGVDHVGLGSDMLGLPHGSVFANYRKLPELAEAMLAAGFSSADVGKVLGGNYARVFAASVT